MNYAMWETLFVTFTLLLARAAAAQGDSSTTQPTTQPGTVPPKTWIDPDTGHRIWRLSDEPNSGPIYFNHPAFTPDGRDMVYLAPDGPRLLNLESRTTRNVASAGHRVIQMGTKSRTLYIEKSKADAEGEAGFYGLNIDTGERRRICDLPARGRIDSVNADETLAIGYCIIGTEGDDYGAKATRPPGLSGPQVQPANKAQMMVDRLNARLPMELFSIDLKTGERKVLLKSTDWLNHILCSPTDPTLIMYCHEGPWIKVDRIWTIRTDGSQNQLMHERTMAHEIAGHEFWSQDGKTIWYDLQRPKGEDFILASVSLETGTRRWYRLTRDEWSIHFNVNSDGTLFCGDGGDTGQVARAKDGKWIYLFQPELLKVSGINKPDFIQPGTLKSQRLVNMKGHNYKAEPNVRFTPDAKMVIYQSNASGASYLFGVEVEKAATETK